MSKPGSSRAQQQVQQEYIARIRYANTLPAPTNPPKLLNIPNDALQTYCDVDFTSKLARENMTNVETDVEGGMSLDLWGLPGVFEGDDSAISALDPIPAPHNDDKALLIPLDRIGKKANTAAVNTNVSFLRRTEYISVRHKTKHYDSPAPRRELEAPSEKEKERENDPVRMLGAVLTGFDIAHPETATEKLKVDSHMEKAAAEWNKIKPGYKDPKTGKTVAEILPLFPDPLASGDTAYMSVKFNVAPVPPKNGHRDTRVDAGLFRVNEDANGATFDYYLPIHEDSVPKINEALSEHNNGDLDIGTAENPIQYSRIREYEAAQTVPTAGAFGAEPDIAEFVLEFQDEDTEERAKGVYWLPLASKVVLRPKRNERVMKSLFRHQSQSQYQNDEEEKVDLIKVTVRDMTQEERARREGGNVGHSGDVDADGEMDDEE